MSKLIVANLKMNMENVSQRNSYCKEIIAEFAGLQPKNTVVFCPQTIYIEYFCRTLKQLPVEIGAQDSFWEMYGSYTGSTSPKSVHSLGGRYVIIGHSERRNFNHETNEEIAKKSAMAIRVGLTPIVCAGFLSHESDMESVQAQVESLVDFFEWEDMQKIVIAYEPVWAIGSGRTPTNDEIHTMIMYIRSILAAKYGKDNAVSVPVLYGGSVNPENIVDICTKAYADGALVGTASLSPEKFVRVVRMIN